MSASPDPAEVRVPLHLRLGFRMAALFGIILLPLAVLSSVQIWVANTEAARSARSADEGLVAGAALPVAGQLARARATAAALAASLAADRSCAARLQAALARPENTGFVLAVWLNGPDRACTTAGGLEAFDWPDTEAPVFVTLPAGTLPQQEVLLVSQNAPRGGRLLLAAPASDFVAHPPVATDQSARPRLVTADRFGGSAGSLPDDPMDSQTLTEDPHDGPSQRVAVIALEDGALLVSGIWPAPDGGALHGGPLLILLPVLLCLAALLLACMVTEQQVLRPVRRLRAAITAFAAGRRRLPDLGLDPGSIPAAVELQGVVSAFDRMVASVLHNEAELEDTIHQKEVLLREVHHRVKNNLQLIASIISLQIRKARSAESRAMLRVLQERVINLATIHRELYQTTGVTDVRADELLHNILHEVQRMSARPDRVFEVSARLEDIRLTPDQAVPLALLVTEALTDGFRHASAAPGAALWLRLSMWRQDTGSAVVEIRNAASGAAPVRVRLLDESLEAGLGEALMRGLCAQLGCEAERRAEDGSYLARFIFSPHALAAAEARLTG